MRNKVEKLPEYLLKHTYAQKTNEIQQGMIKEQVLSKYKDDKERYNILLRAYAEKLNQKSRGIQNKNIFGTAMARKFQQRVVETTQGIGASQLRAASPDLFTKSKKLESSFSVTSLNSRSASVRITTVKRQTEQLDRETDRTGLDLSFSVPNSSDMI